VRAYEIRLTVVCIHLPHKRLVSATARRWAYSDGELRSRRKFGATDALNAR